MKKNLNAWKRTISSVAALAIVLSLGMPFTTAFADETGTPSESSSTPVESAASESSSVSSEAQPAETWEDTAVKAIGTVSGRDGVEKVYNYLQGLEGHKDAQSFQTLAGKVGLTSKVITGTLSGAAHSWNAVQVDGVWYAVDVAKGVLLAGAKTLLADGKTVFGDVYKTADTTVLSGESHQIVVTIMPMADQNKTYGDVDPSIIYTPSINIALEGALSRVPGEDVGEYAYTLGTVKVKDAANAGKYKLELAKDASKFKIEKKTLSVIDVELESETKVANETPSVPVRKVILEGNIPESEVSVNMAGVKAEVSSSEAGIYSKFTVSGLALQGTKAGNYTIAESAEVIRTFVIEAPKDPEVEDESKKNADADSMQMEQVPVQSVNKAPMQTTPPTSDGNVNNEPAGDGENQPDNTTMTNPTGQGTAGGNTTQGGTPQPTNPDENKDKNAGDGSDIDKEDKDLATGDGKTENPANPDGDNPETTPGGTTTTPAEKTVVKIKIESQTKIYGEKDPEIKYIVVDANENKLEDQPNIKVIREQGEDVGEYKYKVVVEEQDEKVKKQYDIQGLVEEATLTIKQKEVEILFRSGEGSNVDFKYENATAYVKSDGSPKTLVAFYRDVKGEEKTATIEYTGNDTIDTSKVGTYILNVTITDENYIVKQPLAISKMVVTEELFTPQNVSVTIAKDDISGKTISLEEFGVPESLYSKVELYTLEQDYVVESYNDSDPQNSKLKIADGILYYQLLPNMQAGKKGNIVLRIEELNLYFRLTVVVGEKSLKMSVRNYPTNVTLGKDIVIPSTCVLVATFDDKSETKEPVTLDMLSGYDKNAKGNDSIGIKTITVTSKKYPGSSANFDIRVNDTVVGLEVEQPDKVDYYTSDSSLDLSGGWVALKMQSGNLKDSK